MPHRRQDIDTAKGLAILLVVFGHLVARQDPTNLHWYEPVRRAIYAFHMPFFMYLSGLTAAISGFLMRGRDGWREAALARAYRLLLPFCGLGLLVMAGKMVAAPYMFVDNVPGGLRAGLSGFFWHTEASPALSAWYIFVLFVLSLATLWLLDAKPDRLPWMLAGALILYVLPVPAYLYANRVATYAFFFLAGAYAGFAGPGWDRLIDQYWRPALAVLVVGLIGVALWGQGEEQKISMLPLGILSMPALHGLLRHLRIGWMHRGFLFLGRYSFVIYLGNTICIGLAKAALMPLLSWNGNNFAQFAIMLMMAGLLGPIAIKRLAFRRIRALDKLTS